MIWCLSLWRLTSLDLSSSSELCWEYCSCSPFPPSIGSTLCLIKHVTVFHGLFHPSFLSHLMNFHANFLQQLWLIFKIIFSTFLCCSSSFSLHSWEKLPFTTYKTESSLSCKTIHKTYLCQDATQQLSGVWYVMTTANPLVIFLSLHFALTNTHFLCLILSFESLLARVIPLSFIHMASSVTGPFISTAVLESYRWEAKEALLT